MAALRPSARALSPAAAQGAPPRRPCTSAPLAGPARRRCPWVGGPRKDDSTCPRSRGSTYRQGRAAPSRQRVFKLASPAVAEDLPDRDVPARTPERGSSTASSGSPTRTPFLIEPPVASYHGFEGNARRDQTARMQPAVSRLAM